MFSTVSNILSWTLWTIKNIFLLFLLLCRLSWKLLLFLVFLDGFYNAAIFLHKFCKSLKSSHEKKKSDETKTLNILHQSSEDVSVVSEMSFNTNEEYVVESWNSYQVRRETAEQRARKSSRWFSEYFWRGRRWWGGWLHRCLQDWQCEWLGLVVVLLLVYFSVVCGVSLNIDIPVTSNTFFPSIRPSSRGTQSVQLH